MSRPFATRPGDAVLAELAADGAMHSNAVAAMVLGLAATGRDVQLLLPRARRLLAEDLAADLRAALEALVLAPASRPVLRPYYARTTSPNNAGTPVPAVPEAENDHFDGHDI